MSDVIVIQFPGVNCEYETVRVLEAVGLPARIVRWNSPGAAIDDAAAVVIPGGFAYQDRIRAGVVAAKDRIMDDVLHAAERGVPVLGICNGAQILVEAGVVPGFDAGGIEVALARNRMPDRSGYYCDWVRLAKGPAKCIFTEFMDATGSVPIPMAHGEGRFVTADERTAARLERGEGVALVYADANDKPATSFPDNPNDSSFSIAGLTNPGGNVLALMPHPERGAWLYQVPRRVGGEWAEKRLQASGAALYRPGPGRGFFESLAKGLSQ